MQSIYATIKISKWFLGASCDVNENYSCATAKKLFDIELEHCLAANYDLICLFTNKLYIYW
jgi:hypothetical protein